MDHREILCRVRERLGIEQLNDMQRAVLAAWDGGGDIVVHAPTGSGKTLAFAVPVIAGMDASSEAVQAVVIAPTRELVLQIHEVMRQLGAGLRVTCCYGGHDARAEARSLAVTPHVLVATPGRLLDHVNRRRVDIATARMLVLDEFDKSLELGFGDDMRQLLQRMPRLRRRVLTSATVMEQLPPYVRLHDARVLDFLDTASRPQERMVTRRVVSPVADKLDTLLQLLLRLPAGKAMVFVNYRDAVERVQGYLQAHGVTAGAYHGALEQDDRERALAMFENGSTPVLVTTDLGARGLDIDAVEHVIHYHLPLTEQVWTHRNGRTARVDATGNAYVLTGPDERCAEWMHVDAEMDLTRPVLRTAIEPTMATLYFQAGKKEKISRGDILGFLVAHGGVEAARVGRITVKDHYALAAVPRAQVNAILQRLRDARLKGRRVRVSRLGE